jgi:hypothetical protein
MLLTGCYLPGCYLPGYPQGVPLLYTGAALRAARGTVYSRADPCGRPAGCRAACGLPGGLRVAGQPAGCRSAYGLPGGLGMLLGLRVAGRPAGVGRPGDVARPAGVGQTVGTRLVCGLPDSLWGRARPGGMALNSVASSLEREVVRCKKTCRNTGNEPNVSRR